jgi:alpha-beta hydrolase superfamily lysophospholipase
MGSWIALNLFSTFKKKIIGFMGIASAPEFLENLMWKKLNKKTKKKILCAKVYQLKHGLYTYPLTKQLIFDGRKNKVLHKKINLELNVTLLHGSKDDVVPLSSSKKILRIFTKAKRKLVKIKNGDHSLSKKGNLKKICQELDIMISDHL